MISKFGRKFEDVSKLFDHAAHNGSNYLNGHCFVSLMLCVPIWSNRRIAYLAVPFAETAQEFILYKRSLGFKYADEPKCLSRFCRFSVEQDISEVEISRVLAEKWIAPREGESEKSRSHRITCVRQFAIYLNNLGYDAYIVPEVKGLNHNSFVPYIFTHDQIEAVIKAADETEPREVARNMHLALPVIFRILYGCGLRVSEVV